MTATLFSDLNEQGYKFSMITTWILSHVRYFVEGERCLVIFFKSLVERRPLLKHWPCDSLFFFPTSVANETENYNIWFKLNQWANIP